MAKSKLDPDIADEVPWSDQVTQYDEENLVTYLCLLDAAKGGATKEEMAVVVLGIDPCKEPMRVFKSFKSHLCGARWMAKRGYCQILDD